MRFEEIHPTFRQALGYHEAFRRMGFRAAEIFIGRGTAPRPDVGAMVPNMIRVFLRTQGKEFGCDCGTYAMPDFQERWYATITAVNDGSMPDAVLEKVWQGSEARENVVILMLAIKEKGIDIPGVMS